MVVVWKQKELDGQHSYKIRQLTFHVMRSPKVDFGATVMLNFQWSTCYIPEI